MPDFSQTLALDDGVNRSRAGLDGSLQRTIQHAPDLIKICHQLSVAMSLSNAQGHEAAYPDHMWMVKRKMTARLGIAS